MIPTHLLRKINPAEYTLLVIDDNQTNLQVIVNYLREFGFKLLMAKDGRMGLKVAAARQPDMILLDVMMPEMDGFEVCRRLKADGVTQDIPVIFMTALTSEDDKVKGFEVGAVDYVTKPIQQREVLARVATHLEICHLNRQLEHKNIELQQANQQLVELNADKDRFFSIVAHDLKGPFMPLLGNSDLLIDMADSLTPQEIRDMGASINRTSKRVLSLLENLLHWARLQMGRMEYSPEPLNLKTVIDETVALLADIAATKNIVLNSYVMDTWVLGDKNMINTVIRNLTNNALKFTPLGGRVILEAHSLGEGVEVAVIDTGVGIRPEDAANLFKLDVYHSTSGTAQEKGTGLGLIMCKEMVEKNGGRIWVESELGKGTSVKFTMRAAQHLN